MLKSFFHTGFVVRDLERSVAFYEDALGLKVKVRAERSGEFAEKVVGFPGAHLRLAFLSMDNGHDLELVQYIVPPSAQGHTQRNDLGASHLAFYVERIDELYQELSRKGLWFLNPPADLVQDGKVVRKAMFAQDPDNNWLEFVEVLQ